ncbi:metal-dependent hydrolase [Anatilimnocola floriformis]|uniref:metal-dependent hydrolase n=1 Tax=Anatilimnocola floriformis TaxID=2948575 RepID=UPI0020C29C61|nr:metal-dependent hydrolase [Anatilimnocola floriformis]
MADFKTHITFSTGLGVVYGVAGHFYFNMPIETSLLGFGLCSVSGMLPDLDSDSGTPVREMSTFAASVIPMLMLPRFEAFACCHEMMVLMAAVMYCIIRFGVVEVFKRYTVHRGMWHSIPACVVCGLITFLIVADNHLEVRFFKAAAVMLGFFSHLFLDEVWSLSVRSGRLNVKKSSGTAIKFFGKDSWGNFSVYGKLVILSLFAVGDPMLMRFFGQDTYFGNQVVQGVIRNTNQRVIQAEQITERAIEEEARRLGQSHLDGGNPTYNQPGYNNTQPPPGYQQPAYPQQGYGDPNNYANPGYAPQQQQPVYPYQR